jgi:hypothetical protein
MWPPVYYCAGQNASKQGHCTAIYEGGHNRPSANKQNHDAQTCDRGGAAAVIR